MAESANVYTKAENSMTEDEKNQIINDLIRKTNEPTIKDYLDILRDVEAIERDQENQDLLKKINILRK